MKIVVLCGGLSNERDVSLCTGSLITKALIDKGHHAVMADVIGDIDLNGLTPVEYIKKSGTQPPKAYVVPDRAPDIAVLRNEVKAKGKGVFGDNVLALCMAADIVFMALHGEDGEDGKIQAALDLMHVKYTGSGYLGSAVAMSKRLTKLVFEMSGIRSPQYQMLFKKEYTPEKLDTMDLPCVVKLNSGGSSIGVYIVHTKEELKSCVEQAFEMEDVLVIEAYIEGQEYTCGVLADEGLPVVEITPNEGFYDYAHKYQPGITTEICPAPSLNPEQTKEVQAISVKAHQALGVEVYSRVDFIMDKKGDFYCLEANTLPGMTPTSLLPQEAKANGIVYEDLCELIINESLKKYEK